MNGHVNAQSRKVDNSRAVDEDAFVANKPLEKIMSKQKNFVFDIKFGKQYENEIILFMNANGKGGSLFVLKWDDVNIDIYHESFRGDGIQIHNEIVTIGNSSDTYKSFREKLENITPSFFLQNSNEKEEDFETEFVFFKRKGAGLDFGICAINGREFKENSNYPDHGFRVLIDLILLEFGGM
jgi:hypothetical protein